MTTLGDARTTSAHFWARMACLHDTCSSCFCPRLPLTRVTIFSDATLSAPHRNVVRKPSFMAHTCIRKERNLTAPIGVASTAVDIKASGLCWREQHARAGNFRAYVANLSSAPSIAYLSTCNATPLARHRPPFRHRGRHALGMATPYAFRDSSLHGRCLPFLLFRLRCHAEGAAAPASRRAR